MLYDAEEHPAWARQHGEPIAVAGEFERLRSPDGAGYETAIYEDGTVLRALAWPSVASLIAAQVRKAIASINFPAYQAQFMDHHERKYANRRATLKDGKMR